MSYSINELKEKSIPLPITYEARMIAKDFAAQQPTPSKKRQVYLNTLAVCVANNYMEMMGTPADLKASDSWNPVLRLCGDVADLKLAELGHLECRPIETVSSAEPDTVLCQIPEEMMNDRIGCMIIEIDLVRRRANLLGFAKALESSNVFLRQLFTMNDFEKYLKEFSPQIIEHSKELVNLSQWFQNIFEAGWRQPVKSLLETNSGDLALGLRGALLPSSVSNIVGENLIEVGSRLSPQVVVLVVLLIPSKNKPEVEIRVKVKAENEQAYLPPDLHFGVIDETGIERMAALSDRDSPSIELQFDALPGERFSIRLGLEGIDVNQEFVL